MDHHGLLTVARRLDQACRVRQTTHVIQSRIWNWDCTAVLYPEAPCTFCGAIMRSPGIWLLNGEKQEFLLGAIFPVAGAKVRILQPNHAHKLNATKLCLGTHRNGVSLLGAPVNLGGVSMSRIHVPRWYKRYWGGHDCQEMRDFIVSDLADSSNPSLAPSLLQELDTPWSMS